MSNRQDGVISRRALLQRGSGLALIAFGPLGCGSGGRIHVASSGRAADAGFLDEREFRALQAVVDRFIPEDLDPGAVAAGCAEAIDALLAAFASDPPRIFAGGPFSDRGGAAHNDFADFLPLDPYEELAWRLKIEGSQGRAEREFNGPRKGWQQIYREGLARLDQRAAEAGFADFAALPAPARDLLLRDAGDAAIAELVDIAFPQTLDAMYGAPEYGGNRDLVGWDFTAYDGDVQPRGYSDEQVTTPDNPGLFDRRKQAGSALPTAPLLPLPDAQQMEIIHQAFQELVAMTSEEFAFGLVLDSESRLSRIRAGIDRRRPGAST